jgi:hypothetical protein
MRKKQFSVVALLALSLIAFSSCGDEDDQEIIDETIIKTDADAIAVADGVWSPIQTLSSSYSFLVESASDGTVSFEGEENEGGPVVSRFEHDKSTWYAIKVFSRLYQSVGAANDAIERITAADAAVTQATKDVTIAKAKFARGLAYSYLVGLFGEVPLVLSTDQADTKTRTGLDAVYTQIVKDLTEAETGLPATDANRSVPTKGAANALLARVYLQWASKPLTQTELSAIASSTTDPTLSWDNDRLAKAAEYADKVISSGTYSLNTDFTHLYGREYESKQPEHIFTIHHDGDAYDAQGNHQAHCAFTFAFEITKETHIGPADVDLYTAPRWADDNDVRREFSYTTSLDNPLEPLTGGGFKTYSFTPPVTLARFGKGIDRSYDNSVNISPLTNEVDRIELRYAEVLLTKAEALLEQGNDAGALALVNQVRARAGVSALALSGNELRTALRTEWDHEFVYDQRRWFDLVRWKTLISTVQSVSTFTHYAEEYKTALTTGTAEEKESSTFFAKVYKHLHAKHDNVKGKHYRFPIPLGESSEELGITPQNPGY